MIGSAVVGVCYPLGMGYEVGSVRGAGATLGLAGSIFGLTRFEGLYLRMLFAGTTGIIAYMMHKLLPKAIKSEWFDFDIYIKKVFKYEINIIWYIMWYVI